MRKNKILGRKRFVAGILVAAMAFTMLPASFVQARALPENVPLAREILGEGMVLLKNEDNALPLKKTDTIAIFGQGQRYVGSSSSGYQTGGGGSGAQMPAYTPVGPIDALIKAEDAGKIKLYHPLIDAYQKDISYMPDEAMYNAAAAKADKAVMFISRFSSEGSDRKTGKGDWLLSDVETAMMKTLSEKFDCVIVLTNVGGVIDTSWAVGDVEGIDIEALMMIWQGGAEGGNGVADVLLGKVNPSGKLTDTCAKSIDDYPTTESFYSSSSVDYKEDVFVGYRYFETFDPGYEKVNYEFGYGLSYTTFDISDVKYSVNDEEIVVRATVKNTGDVAGKEVVQLYFSPPQMGTDGAVLSKPAKELAAFQKTGIIKPAKSETITLKYPIADMATFDDTGLTGNKSAYVLEAGDYKVYIGNSVKNVRLAGTYNQKELAVTGQLVQLVAPNRLQERLLADGSMEVLSEVKPVAIISSTGETKIEGESFTAASEQVRVQETNGVKYVDYINAVGRYVEYCVRVEESGFYDLYFHQANGKRVPLKDILNVYVDGEKLQNISLDCPATGGWDEFADSTVNMIQMEKGIRTIRFSTKNGKFSNVDYFVLKPHTSVAISADIPTVLEAEYFQEKGTTGTADAPTTEWFAAERKGQLKVNGVWVPYEGGTLAYMHTAGNWVSYNLDVEEAGTYEVSFRMSNGRSRVDDVLSMLVDEKNQNVIVTCPQTGDGNNKSEWYNFIDIDKKYDVQLPAGECKLKLVSKTANFPNIDKITFVRKIKIGRESVASNLYRNFRSAQALNDDAEIITLKDVRNGSATLEQLVGQMSIEELASFTTGHVHGIGQGTGSIGGSDDVVEKYEIPRADTADGPGGLRIDSKSTAWGCQVLSGCTWNTELLERFGEAVGKEAVASEVDIWLAPGMNIHRNPMCGRNFEYYSEDPLLTGKMGAAVARGVQKQSVAVTIKHFACNNKEGNRNSSDSRVTERALREIYLRGFEIAVKEGNPWCVMSSYNFINGTEASERQDLLTGILRGEWGFDGFVMTDWDNQSNIVKELKAGNNVKMPSGNDDSVVDAYEKGEISRELLEANAIDIIKVLVKLPDVTIPKIPVIHPVPASQSTKIEAEEYDSKYAGVSLEYGNVINVAYMDRKVGDEYVSWVAYKLDVAQAGTYRLNFRIANNVSGKDILELSINNKVQDEIVFDSPSTGGWQIYKDRIAGEIKLPAGKVDLKIKSKGNFGNLDYFTLQLLGVPKTGDMSVIPMLAAALASGSALGLAKKFKR